MKRKQGERLKALRGDRSRREVASALGVTVDAIAKYENGQRTPTDSMKMKIAEYFEKDIVSIFFN